MRQDSLICFISRRCLNGLAGELNAEFYEKEDAIKCLSYAESILKKVKKSLKV